MLSLMSSASDRLTGTRSFVNWVIGCGTPSSSIVKSFCSRVLTSRPSASRTVTAVVTSSDEARKLFERPSTVWRAPSGTTSSGNTINGRSLLGKVIECAARPNEQLAVGRHRRGEHLIVKRVHLKHVPLAFGADDRHRSVLAHQPHLAVGADRRCEILVNRAFEPALLDHVAGLRVERDQDAAVVHHVEHAFIQYG